MSAWKWVAEAEYEDGEVVEKHFPYIENDDYRAEADRQYQLEEWLIERAHPQSRCVWYSVNVWELD